MATKKHPAATKPTAPTEPTTKPNAPTEPTEPAENVTPEPSKRKKLVVNNAFIDKIIEVLEKGKISKEDLAKELGLSSPNQISKSIKLEVVLRSENVHILNNIVETGKRRKNQKTERPIVFSPKRGIIIPIKKLAAKEIEAGQKYELQQHRNGSLTLKPVKSAE